MILYKPYKFIGQYGVSVMHKRNTQGLKEFAEKKKQEALEKTEEAIKQLIKAKEKITFNSVAEKAKVSTSWLYQQSDIVERIKYLRSKNDSKYVAPKERASEASKDSIILTLRQRIKELTQENKSLKTTIEDVYGQLYVNKGENERLLREINALNQEIEKYQNNNSHKSNKQSKKEKSEFSQEISISNEIKNSLDETGIVLNSTLSKLIKSAPEEVVINAINCLKEARTKKNVRCPESFLAEAIKNGWVPSEHYQLKSELDNFAEWYPLAKKRGIAIASQKIENAINIYTSDEQWIPFKEMLDKYPIETLST